MPDTHLARDLHIEHEQIDQQHEHLANIIGKIYHAMQMQAPHATTLELFQQLITSTQEHFAYEENLLRQSDYPDLDGHLEEHNELLHQLEGLRQRLRSGSLEINMHMMILLKDWLLNHVDDADRAYVSHLKAKFSDTLSTRGE